MENAVYKDLSRQEKAAVEILDRMYKNAEMGGDSIVDIMPKVTSDALRADLTAQLTGYEEWSQKSSRLLKELYVEPKEENIVAKAGAKVGMFMNTMVDSTDSHIADMVIKGSNMGITDLTKLINRYEEVGSCRPDALQLAKDMREFEEKNLEKMKPYL